MNGRRFKIPQVCLLLSCLLAASPAFAITAFTPQTQPIGSVGQEVVTNGTLTSGTETLFRTEYEKEFWGGNIYAFPISATGVVNTAAERWSGGAAVHISAQNFSTGRFIGTLKDDGTKVPFISPNLSAAQQTALTITVNNTAYTSAQIVNYLRGDHSLESSVTLRQRLTRQGSSTLPTALGDIIHSKIYYLADATNPTIFVGANDGMMHAIDASNGGGDERWAYVPSMLQSKMKNLANYPYVHDYFVDGQIAVGTANISGATCVVSGSCRILAGGLGAGGKGLYALNIDGATGLTASTDQQAADKILWEITPTQLKYASPSNTPTITSNTNYSNLGYSYGTPQIKNVNVNGTLLKAVLIGNGYNNGGINSDGTAYQGDYQAYLYVINAATGALIRAIKADSTATNTTGTTVTNGTAASPNGLFNILAFDSSNRGYIDRVYAGDLNGAMWRFDLSSATPASWTASVLQVTSPKQPITATPAAMPHPSGMGFMINFGSGSIFSGTQPTTGTGATGDLGDTSTFYVYGIWDGAPVTNTTLTSPVLSERCYNTAGTPSALPCPDTQTRVRRVTSATPNWAAGGNKGWKVALPIGGERVIGEGSFISSGRYYFTTYNPTISYLVPTTSTYIWGENWQMALESITGGSVDPFMDLNNDSVITSDDRIKYTASDAAVISGAQTVNTPILTPNVDGIEVGKWVARGVQSQPALVKLTSLFTTLFNVNPDVTFPAPPPVGTGVNGGHFDEDIYFGAVTASRQATATLTIGSTGSALPATLGGIRVDPDGLLIVPALTTSDLLSGTATATNATTIKNNLIPGSGYTVSGSGSTITFTAPVGASYNGKTLTVLAGTSQALVTGVYASSSFTFTNSAAINPTGVNISVNGTNIMTQSTPGSTMTSSQLASWVAAHSSLSGYNITANSSTVTITATTAATSTYDISSLTVNAATASASTITGTPSYTNGVTPVTAVTGVTGVYPTALVTISGTTDNTNPGSVIAADLSGPASVKVGSNVAKSTAINIGKNISASNTRSAIVTAIGTAGIIDAYSGRNAITPTCAGASSSTTVFCLVDTSTYTNGASVSIGTRSLASSQTFSATTTSGGVTPVTAVAGVTGVAASASFTFNNATALTPTVFAVTVNGTNIMTASTPGSAMSSTQLAAWVAANSSLTGYTISASSSTVTIRSTTTPGVNISSIVVSGSVPVVTYSTSTPVAGVTAVTTGWSNLAPALSTTSFSGGADGSTAGDTCTSTCQKDTHVHQYDKIYDVTGVNMLNASTTNFNLSRAIPNINQNFKVIMHNQYLNPAVKINIGRLDFVYNVDYGYTSVKNYTTSATLDLATLPTYNQNPASTGDGFTTGPKYIGSLAINMPVNALSSLNWWGNGDVRPGLIPTTPGCVYNAAGSNDGNMYQPVKAPANNPATGYPPDGPGTNGWSSTSPTTTPATAVGVRHGGALTVQIIKDITPNSAIELNDHLGRPEYGWRVRSSSFSTYVLDEYNTYWHHPTSGCFNDSTWSKNPGADNGTSAAQTKAAGSTDPHIGNLSGTGGSGGNVCNVSITGDTTVINYVDGSQDVIQRIVNANMTVTTTTTHYPAGTGGCSGGAGMPPGGATPPGGTPWTSGSPLPAGGSVTTTTTTVNAAGSGGSGGLLNQNAVGYKRIFWKELIRN